MSKVDISVSKTRALQPGLIEVVLIAKSFKIVDLPCLGRLTQAYRFPGLIPPYNLLKLGYGVSNPVSLIGLLPRSSIISIVFEVMSSGLLLL
jgi:hypothetical protein